MESEMMAVTEEERNSKIHCWPTREQKLLLKAAILGPEEAIPAWEEWKSRVIFDDMDEGSARVIPLVFHNLHSHLSSDSLMNRCKTVYWFNWVKNQYFMREIMPDLKMIHEKGIKVLFLKGASLLLLDTYSDYGLRPMDDMDVLVPQERAVEVMSLMDKRGWKRTGLGIKGARNLPYEKLINITHAADFRKEGLALDIHWHPLVGIYHTEIAQAFRQRAKPMHWEGIEVWCQDPADQLLTVCLHGLQFYTLPIHWIVDAVMILKTHPDLDWDRIVRTAQNHHLAYPLKQAFRYLEKEFHVVIPKKVTKDIGAVKVSRIERIFFLRRIYRIYTRKLLFPDPSDYPDYLWRNYLYFLLAYYDRRQLDEWGYLGKLFKFTPFALKTVGFWNAWRIPYYYLLLFVRGRFALLP